MNVRFISLGICLFIAAAAFAADAPAAGDREALIAQLERTRARFLASVEGLSEGQWNYKPSPERWSVAECAEHITAAESFIRKMVADSMKGELAADAAGSTNQDQKILTFLVDRSTKFKAPEPLMPTNRFGTPAAAIAAYEKERAETIALASSDVDLRTHGAKHFALGDLDSYGWFLFLSAHSERHTLQIDEVKADPGFPKQ
ncbi:MAG TPA: DinB family protein [Thermoanaerobaculia bacterium]|nr:DinB family protein [Thermoanaerobaculia bacterium]